MRCSEGKKTGEGERDGGLKRKGREREVLAFDVGAGRQRERKGPEAKKTLFAAPSVRSLVRPLLRQQSRLTTCVRACVRASGRTLWGQRKEREREERETHVPRTVRADDLSHSLLLIRT